MVTADTPDMDITTSPNGTEMAPIPIAPAAPVRRGIRPSDLVANKRTVVMQVPVEGGSTVPVSLTYRPDFMRGPLARELRQSVAANDAQAALDASAELLLAALAAWDIEDDDGGPLPITKAHLTDTLGLWFMNACIVAINEDMTPNPPNRRR